MNEITKTTMEKAAALAVFESLASGNEFVLSSVVKEMGQSVEDVVRADVEGKFDSTPYVGTL